MELEKQLLKTKPVNISAALLAPQTTLDENERNADPLVAHLHEDVWSMTFVLSRKGKGIHICLTFILVIIYLIQLCSLFTLIKAYGLFLNYDVNVYYNIQSCISDGHPCPEWNSSDITLGLVESEARNSEYIDYENAKSHLNIFGWAALLSMLLLSIYTFSTVTNSITMLVIAKNYDIKDGKDTLWCNLKRCHVKIKCVQGYCCGNEGLCDLSRSGFLRIMAFSNIFLAAFAYCIGFFILSSYSLYFGIEDPTQIILAPIGIVFILEIDDWAFSLFRHWYRECNDEDLWALKASYFKFNFTNEYRNHVSYAIVAWFFVSIVCCIVSIEYSLSLSDEATESTKTAGLWERVTIISGAFISIIFFFVLIRVCQHQRWLVFEKDEE